MNIAIVGATGNVGRKTLEVLEQKKLPINKIYLVAFLAKLFCVRQTCLAQQDHTEDSKESLVSSAHVFVHLWEFDCCHGCCRKE